MPIGQKIRQAYRQKNFKINVILSAIDIFNLSESEAEILANKAGISSHQSPHFNTYLKSLIQKSHKKHKAIYDQAMISDRMFRHIKSDYRPTKTSLLAIALSLELETDEIYNLLQKAGYILSKSIAFDMVIKWLLEHARSRKNLILDINDVLYGLDLPLLMTRDKS